jgi:hypothetical protein
LGRDGHTERAGQSSRRSASSTECLLDSSCKCWTLEFCLSKSLIYRPKHGAHLFDASSAEQSIMPELARVGLVGLADPGPGYGHWIHGT